MAGEIPESSLAAYHRSYGEFIRKVPGYWERIVEAFQPGLAHGSPVVREEEYHARLWDAWGSRLPSPESFPRLNALTDAMDTMTPSSLLGALQAFEIQQPEVARTKKQGLISHYGVPEDELTYFDEHQKEEGHIAYGRSLAERYACKEEYERGFREGAELVYRSLDLFPLK